MRAVHRWTSRKLGLCATLLVVAAAGAGALISTPTIANAKKAPIRIGILQPVSDPSGNADMLKDVVLMMIEEQNRKGGLLGRKLEPVALSPADAPHAEADAARNLLNRDRVSAVFSANLDETGPDVQQLFSRANALLFDSAPTSGEDSPVHVLRTGAAPNQQALPAVDYLSTRHDTRRWVLVGTDAAWPRATNRIIEADLKARGVPAQDILIIDTPANLADWTGIIGDIRAFAGDGRNTAVISTLLGDTANNGFYKSLAAQGLSGHALPPSPGQAGAPEAGGAAPSAAPHAPLPALPVLSLSLGEEDLPRLDWNAMTGTLIAGNYVTSSPTPDNKAFLERWRNFSQAPERLASDRVEAHRLGFSIWAKAVAKAGTVDAEPVAEAMTGIKQLSLTGGIVQMLPNRHITRTAFIGEVDAQGALQPVWKSPSLIPGSSRSEMQKSGLQTKAEGTP